MRRVIYLLGFAVLAIIIKSINLKLQPLYLDEGLYIFWSKLFFNSDGFAYVSMQDGKTPLFMWTVAFVYTYLHDIWLSGRLVSVFSGAFSLACMSIIALKIFDFKTAVWVAILFLVTPYTYLIERMALVDGMMVGLSTAALLSLISAHKLIEKRNNIAVVLMLFVLTGIFLGLSYLTKSPAKIFVVLNALLCGYWAKRRIVLYIVGALIFSLIFLEIQGYLRVGAYQFWGQMLLKESQLTYTVSEVVWNILHIYRSEVILQSLHMFQLGAGYLLYYATAGLCFAVVGAWQIIHQKKNYWVIGYPILIFVAIIFFAKVNSSRYVYMAVPFLLLLSGVGVSYVWSKYKLSVICIFGFSLLQVGLMLFKPQSAIYTHDDQSYLYKSNLSALGLSEIQEYLKNKNDVVVGVSGVWGVLEGTQVVLEDAGIDNINIDPWRANLSKLEGIKGKKYIYLSRGDADLADLSKEIDFKVVKEFTRPWGGSTTYLLEVINN